MKKILLILILIVFFIQPVNAVLKLNETFKFSGVNTTYRWETDDGGIFSQNSTNPLYGNYSGYESDGAAWGYAYTNFTNTTNNITINLIIKLYGNRNGGFLIGQYPWPSAWGYENAFQFHCGMGSNTSQWGYYTDVGGEDIET